LELRCGNVNNFEKLEKLGEGTFSSVFMARTRSTDEIVAVKKV